MNKKIKVWGREFDLNVFFETYEKEEILDNQIKALDMFIDASKVLLSSYRELEKYCLNKDGDLIGNSIDNIFKYVIPEQIFVERNENKHVVALLCNYRFDEEHGLALIFENEKLRHIGPQDDIL